MKHGLMKFYDPHVPKKCKNYNETSDTDGQPVKESDIIG